MAKTKSGCKSGGVAKIRNHAKILILILNFFDFFFIFDFFRENFFSKTNYLFIYLFRNRLITF